MSAREREADDKARCGSDGGRGIGAGHVCSCNNRAGHDGSHGCECGAIWTCVDCEHADEREGCAGCGASTDLLPVPVPDADTIKRAAEIIGEHSLDFVNMCCHCGDDGGDEHTARALAAANLLASPVREPDGDARKALVEAIARRLCRLDGAWDEDEILPPQQYGENVPAWHEYTGRAWEVLDEIEIAGCLTAAERAPGRSEAEIKAEALREAADEIAELAENYPEDIWPSFGEADEVPKDRAAAYMARHIYRNAAPAWLRDRAAQVSDTEGGQ